MLVTWLSMPIFWFQLKYADQDRQIPDPHSCSASIIQNIEVRDFAHIPARQPAFLEGEVSNCSLYFFFKKGFLLKSETATKPAFSGGAYIVFSVF